MKNSFGFTLVEVVIVTAIIAILAVISVPIYRGNVERSYTLEGQALLNEFSAAQEIFRGRHNRWWGHSSYPDEKIANDTILKRDLGVDTKRNYYFKELILRVEDEDNTDFNKGTGVGFYITAIATGPASGITMVLTYNYDSRPTITATKNEKPIKGYSN